MSIGTIIILVIYVLYGLVVASEVNCPKKTNVRNARINSDLDNAGDGMAIILFLPIILLHGLILKIIRKFYL